MYALEITHLTKTYSNGFAALKGISFNVEEGDFFALLGKNGAGKSTTIGILTSLINKTSGHVKVFDYDMDKELDAAKLCIGIVPQEVNFSPFETLSQILINQAGYYGIPRKEAKIRAEFYLKKMDLWNKRDQISLRLSGGMKRRLMIARALMNRPRLLVLDEPTAGVDIELRHHLWKFLAELNAEGTTIILTTHYLEEAETLCKNLAILDEGLIIEKANMKELVSRLPVQTLILDLENPITNPQSLAQYNPRFIDELTLEVQLHQQMTLNELFLTFHNNNIIIRSLRNKTNRLEELFVNIVAK